MTFKTSGEMFLTTTFKEMTKSEVLIFFFCAYVIYDVIKSGSPQHYHFNSGLQIRIM